MKLKMFPLPRIFPSRGVAREVDSDVGKKVNFKYLVLPPSPLETFTTKALSCIYSSTLLSTHTRSPIGGGRFLQISFHPLVASSLTPTPQLPLYETNAALAHFDRMQFSLFYSFPFLFFAISPPPPFLLPLMARWSYKIISKYMCSHTWWRMNFAYLVCCVAAAAASAWSRNILFFAFPSSTTQHRTNESENSLSGRTREKSSPQSLTGSSLHQIANVRLKQQNFNAKLRKKLFVFTFDVFKYLLRKNFSVFLSLRALTLLSWPSKGFSFRPSAFLVVGRF
jgi:hypothetical protein